MLRGQPALFGEIASISTARRCPGLPRALARHRPRLADAIDLESKSRIARSGVAAGHYKGGFGFHPLLVSCGREVLAGVLRPGNAGANNAADHLDVLELALEQLPHSALDGVILARSDSAGASHNFALGCRETRILHVAGQITRHARRTKLHLPADWPWSAAIPRAFKRLNTLPAYG